MISDTRQDKQVTQSRIMPPDLLKAHKELDSAVDRAYGIKKPFASESERLEFLFGMYQRYLSAEKE